MTIGLERIEVGPELGAGEDDATLAIFAVKTH